MTTAPPPVKRALSQQAFLLRLREAVNEAGGASALARRMQVSPVYLSRVLSGNRLPSSKITEYLGYQRVVVFVPAEKTD